MADGYLKKKYEPRAIVYENVYVHVCVCLHEMNVQLKTINTSNEALNTRIMARQMYDGIHTPTESENEINNNNNNEKTRMRTNTSTTHQHQVENFKWSF